MGYVMIDPVTKINLTVPASLVDRYKEAGYIDSGEFIEGGSDTGEKSLADFTNKELVAYGKELGLDLKQNTKKEALLEAIERRLSEVEDADGATGDDSEEDSENDDSDTSQNW